MLYFIYNLFSIIFFLFFYCFIEAFDCSIDITFLELYLSVLYFISIIWSLINFNKYPLFLLIFIVFGIFIYSRFILDLFNSLDYPINLATRFVGDYFKMETIQETILAYIVSLIALSLSLSFICFCKVNQNTYNNNFFKKLGFYLILLSLPGVIFKMFITLKMALSSGYLSLYLASSNSGIERIIEFFSYKLYIVGVSFYISSSLSRKDFIKLSIFTLPIAIAYLISGKRGDFGVTILFLIWYWFSFLRIYDISLKKIVVLGVMLLIPFSLIFQYVNNSRSNGNCEVNGIVHPITQFLAQQGVSGIVLPYYIEYNDLLSKDYPYIISPIIDRMNRGGQSVDLLKNTNYLGYELTAVLDYDAFLRGEGLGTTYISELYSIGNSKISVFIGMLFLGFLILYFEINKNKAIFKYLSYLFLSTILFLPRGELFELFYEFVFLIMVWIFVNKIFLNRNLEESKI